MEKPALAALLITTSWYGASSLGGAGAAVGYGVAVTLVVLVGLPWATDRVGRASRWVLPALVGVVITALAVLFVAGVPASVADAVGVGSDRANALDVALSRVAEGAYPYTATTYLQNPITPLPGALVLAAPFWWATGSAATQNLAWVLLLLPVLNAGPRLRPRPTLLWALTVVGGLEVLRQFVIGDDLALGVVPAVAAAAWALRAADGRSTGALAVAGAVLGVTTCTRPHLALVVVIVVVAVGHPRRRLRRRDIRHSTPIGTAGAVVAGAHQGLRSGARRAAVVGGCAGLAWVVLIVPFLLGGVSRFSPLHVAAKVTGDRGVTLEIVLVAVAALVLLVGALAVVRPSSPRAVGWCAAAVLAAPSVLSLVLGLTVGPTGAIDLTLGAAAVPFAVWATARSGDRAAGADAEHPGGMTSSRSRTPSA